MILSESMSGSAASGESNFLNSSKPIRQGMCVPLTNYALSSIVNPSLNQHRIAERRESGIQCNKSTIDFEKEFKDHVIKIGRVLVLMSPWDDPENLKRVWCIFECYVALEMKCELSIVMPWQECEIIKHTVFSPLKDRGIDALFDSLYKALNKIDVAKAESCVPEDGKKILEVIRQRMGFQRLNMFVRDCLRGS